MAEAHAIAESRVAEQRERSEALLSAVSAEAHARVAEAVARAEAAEAALAVAEVDAAWSRRGQRALARSALCDCPPLQRPTRVLRPMHYSSRPDGERSLAAWLPRRSGKGGPLGLLPSRRLNHLWPPRRS